MRPDSEQIEKGVQKQGSECTLLARDLWKVDSDPCFWNGINDNFSGARGERAMLKALMLSVLACSLLGLAAHANDNKVIAGVERCEQIGGVFASAAESRDAGIPMSAFLEALTKASGHAPDAAIAADRAFIQYIAAIYADASTPAETRKLYVDACIQNSSKTGVWPTLKK